MQTIPQRNDVTLAEMVRRLVDSQHPTRIYLFGSRARATNTADSDYDLMVVIPHSDLPRWQRDQIAFKSLCGIGAAKDVLVYTQAEFDAQSTVTSSLPAETLSEGLLVYAA